MRMNMISMFFVLAVVLIIALFAVILSFFTELLISRNAPFYFIVSIIPSEGDADKQEKKSFFTDFSCFFAFCMLYFIMK